jgi:pimeloyl-ACP methyl ester carboxylesterase
MFTRFLIAVSVLLGAFMSLATAQTTKPTIVLVHGAFAESSSWNGVVAELLAEGYPVIAAANPLRGVKSDAAFVASIVDSIKGPVVLVGHSYGGSVISNVNRSSNVKALVYVSAFALDQGESSGEMSNRFPGSTLGDALAAPVSLSDGHKDLYIRQDDFGSQFAADLPAKEGRLAAATQRPIAETALAEASGIPAWKSVPSWHIYGDADKNIPPAAMAFMANRAKSKETIVLKGASHVPMLSQPGAVVTVIKHAAAASL